MFYLYVEHRRRIECPVTRVIIDTFETHSRATLVSLEEQALILITEPPLQPLISFKK